MSQRVDALLVGLGEGRFSDPVVMAWNALYERYCKENNLIWHQDFPAEHPIQEVERLLTSVLIRHLSLGPLVLAVVDRELSSMNNSPPKPIIDLIRFVYNYFNLNF